MLPAGFEPAITPSQQPQTTPVQTARTSGSASVQNIRIKYVQLHYEITHVVLNSGSTLTNRFRFLVQF